MGSLHQQPTLSFDEIYHGYRSGDNLLTGKRMLPLTSRIVNLISYSMRDGRFLL